MKKKQSNTERIKRSKHIALVYFLRQFNPGATHCFFFSAKQNAVGREFPNPLREHHCYFKGVEYSEMKGFEFGLFSNWDDAIFLGIGSYKDITFTIENYIAPANRKMMDETEIIDKDKLIVKIL